MSDEQQTAKHLVVESLTVRAPGSPFKVVIGAYNGSAGIWVSTGNGNEQLGLCAQTGQGVYLDIWGVEAKGLPTAFCADGIQVAGPSEAGRTFLSFADLIAAVKSTQKGDVLDSFID